MPLRLTALLTALIAALLSPSPALAQFDMGGEQVQAALIAETQTAQPGEPITVGVRLTIEYPWHVYWTNPEGDGTTPTVIWDLPEGTKVSAARWPAPQTFLFLGATQFGYEHELIMLYDLTPPADAAGDFAINAAVEWLVCDSANCIPGDTTLSLTLPLSGDAPQNSTDAGVIRGTEQLVPREVEGWSFAAERVDAGYTLIIEATTAEAAASLSGLYYFSQEKYVVEPSAEQAMTVEGNTVKLSLADRTTDPYGSPLERDEPVTELNGVITAESGFGDSGAIAIPVRVGFDGESPAPPADDTSANDDASEDAAGTAEETGAADAGSTPPTFFAAIGLAFLGGVILNLMPCVFPVLSIKILGFVQQSGENPAIVRRHGYAFGAGVLISFWALVAVLLGLRAAAAAATGGDASSVSWGFQLQNPVFVLFMLVLVFVIGLNLIGTFEIGIGLSTAAGKAGQSVKKDGYAKSFSTGVLATLIATPCTGPFMAPALGAALQMPAFQAFVVFTALGGGMALPYVLLSCFPKLLDYLPKPGAWMESFKQAMAFPMFATAAWLAWGYNQAVGDNIIVWLLIGMTIVAMGLWIYGRWATPIRTPRTRWIARALALITLFTGIFIVQNKANTIEQQRIDMQLASESGQYVPEWVAFSPETVDAMRQTGRPVLIDFTAWWCQVCQVNKRSTLRTDVSSELYEQYDVVLIEADYGQRDPVIGRALAEYDREGLPLYLVFPADGGEPEILPQLLSPSILEAAIERAAAQAPTDTAASNIKPVEKDEADPINAIDYSAKPVQQLRDEGRTVLVDVYAKWDPLTQVNQLVLRSPDATRLIERYNVALVGADVTDTINQETSQLLTEYNRTGVPLTVVYPPTDHGGEPIVMPDRLKISHLEKAFEAIADSSRLSMTEPGSPNR